MDEIIRLYNYRSDYLIYKEDYEEINLYTFLELLFDSSEMPFEDVLCDEYKRWRDNDTKELQYIDGQPYKYNALVLHERNKRNGNGKFNSFSVLLRGDYSKLEQIRNNRFAIMSPVTYVGGRASYANARFLYALAFDLDGVGESQINNLFHQIDHFHERVRLPRPNIVVNSGNGLHLYYLLDRPVPMYSDYVKILSKLKHALTYRIWNAYTSNHKNRQVQGVVQAFRLPESQTKFGKPVRAFYNSSIPRWNVRELNEYVLEDARLSKEEIAVIEMNKKSDKSLNLKQAKKLYPEWYERRIVQGDKTSKRWHINRGLYDWWHNRLLKAKNREITVGHRYYCLLVLVSLARKCDVPFDEVRTDAYNLVPLLEFYSSDEHNPFTKDDADSALKAYYKDYSKISVDTIERLTAMRVDRTRRNGQKQKDHLEIARAIRDIKIKQKGLSRWDERNGRPKETPETSQYAKKISKWRSSNPQGNKSECARDLGYSRPTVIKWWNS